jgi:hypothetical protein
MQHTIRLLLMDRTMPTAAADGPTAERRVPEPTRQEARLWAEWSSVRATVRTMSTDAEISTCRPRSSASASPTGPSLDTTVRMLPSRVSSFWPTIAASVELSYVCNIRWHHRSVADASFLFTFMRAGLPPPSPQNATASF